MNVKIIGTCCGLAQWWQETETSVAEDYISNNLNKWFIFITCCYQELKVLSLATGNVKRRIAVTKQFQFDDTSWEANCIISKWKIKLFVAHNILLFVVMGSRCNSTLWKRFRLWDRWSFGQNERSLIVNDTKPHLDSSMEGIKTTFLMFNLKATFSWLSSPPTSAINRKCLSSLKLVPWSLVPTWARTLQKGVEPIPLCFVCCLSWLVCPSSNLPWDAATSNVSYRAKCA